MKKILSVILTFCIVMSLFVGTGISVDAATSGNFTYNVLSDNTAEITRVSTAAQTIEIPEEIDGHKVSKITGKAFSTINGIRTITVESGNEYYTAVDGVLFTADMKELVKYPQYKQDETYTVPNTVEVIGVQAFMYVAALKSLTVPASVKTISDEAFANVAIQNITLNDGLETIGLGAFRYSKAPKSIEIPKTVTSMGEYAFYQTAFENITLNDGLETMGQWVFGYISNIKSIEIPKTVKSIPPYAFANSGFESIILNEGLETIEASGFTQTSVKTIDIPDSVTLIGDSAFAYSGLTSAVIPDGITTINYNVFALCESLISLTIPKSVTEIKSFIQVEVIYGYKNSFAEKYATNYNILFIPLDNLSTSGIFTYIVLEDNTAQIVAIKTLEEAIEIPAEIDGYTVSSVTPYAFLEAPALKNITVASENEYYTATDGVLFNADKTELVAYPQGKTDEVYTVPNGVKNILKYAFRSSKLKNVTLNDGLTEIGEGAFYKSTALSSIAIPETVTTLGTSAFEETGVTTVTFNSTLQTIADKAFANTASLKSVEIPENITSIGESAFENSGIDSLTLNEGLLTIGDSAFANIKSLKSVEIPKTVKTIGSNAFYSSNIENITLKEGLEEIGSSAFSRTKYLKSIEIPASVKSIGSSAFSSSAIENVILHEGLEEIGSSAFSSTDYLKSIEIPKTVKVIDWSVFSSSKIENVILHEGLEEIQVGAFSRAASLKSIEVPKTVKSIESYAFQYSGLESITLNEGLETIEMSAFADCTSLKSITLPKSVTTIDASAFKRTPLETIYGYTGSTAEQYAENNNITFIALDEEPEPAEFEYKILADGTAELIDYISSEITVEVPAEIDGFKVTSIAEDTFYHDFRLESITVSADNEYFRSIDGVLFNADKTVLMAYPCGRKNEEYTVPDGVTKIGDYAFGSVDALKNISFPNTLTHIGNSAFSAYFLESVELPQSVESIGEGAFLGCFNLKSVTLSSNMTKIPKMGFSSCAITTIEIPDGITTIDFGAFTYCADLTSITIPKSVTSIDLSAFTGTPLEVIYGYTDSYAEQYAENNNITFIALDGELPECDLYVSSALTMQSNIADGDQISFRATVRNIGENTSGSYTASFYMNGRLIGTVEIENGIRAGGTAQITSSATSTAFFGKGSVTVIIECANDNENSNDRMKSRFTVE